MNPKKGHCYWGYETSGRQDEHKDAAVQSGIWMDLVELRIWPLLCVLLCICMVCGKLRDCGTEQFVLIFRALYFMEYWLHILKYLWDKNAKPSELQNNSLISHSKPHKIYYSDSKSPHDACKPNSHFCTVMSKLASVVLPQPAPGLCWWCYLRYMKQCSFFCCLNTERPQVRGEIRRQPPRCCCCNVGDRAFCLCCH